MQSVSEGLRERRCLQSVNVAQSLRRDHAGRTEQGIIARSSNNRPSEQAGRRVRATASRGIGGIDVYHARYTRNRSTKSTRGAPKPGTRALGLPLSGQPKEAEMRFPHSILLVACIALFPGMAWSQGGGGAAGGAGSGAAGAGAAGPGGGRGGVGTSAISGGNAVGGGAPAGAVGGGAPAGAVGGGAPTNSAMTPAAPGSDPTSNAAVPNSGAANPSSAGGVVGAPTGTGTSGAFGQGGAPPVMGQAQPTTVPPEVRGAADFTPLTTTGLATTAADGVSTKVVPARPCSTAARETDGTTTCVGIPNRRN